MYEVGLAEGAAAARWPARVARAAARRFREARVRGRIAGASGRKSCCRRGTRELLLRGAVGKVKGNGKVKQVK